MYVNVNLLKTIDVEVIEYCKVVYIFSKSFCLRLLQLVANCGSYLKGALAFEMWQKLVVVSSHLSERGGCEKNVVKADEQERVT